LYTVLNSILGFIEVIFQIEDSFCNHFFCSWPHGPASFLR
jgi:hypothetical protein